MDKVIEHYCILFDIQSRVVHTNPGERNFHIFFKLLSGTDPDLLGMLRNYT